MNIKKKFTRAKNDTAIDIVDKVVNNNINKSNKINLTKDDIYKSLEKAYIYASKSR